MTPFEQARQRAFDRASTMIMDLMTLQLALGRPDRINAGRFAELLKDNLPTPAQLEMLMGACDDMLAAWEWTVEELLAKEG